MPEGLARVVSGVLLAVHLGLGMWAAVGFIELYSPRVPWSRVSNPLFSDSMLFLQWTLIAVSSSLFVVGYVRRWKRTPLAMLLVYSAMALVCAYQTFFILTSETRFVAMAIEYLEYAVILAFLFLSKPMRARFA
jgi:hypothetical protein